MSKQRISPRHITYTGRVVYVRKRHFFTEKDVTRILYNMHDNNHYDVFWQLFSMLLLEFRIILDLIEITKDARAFMRLFFEKVWESFIYPNLGRVASTIWDFVGLLGISEPYDDLL